MVTENQSNKSADMVKFLSSYGGKILPRFTDGKLRYVDGLTRVLAVHRSISYAELMVKLGEFCGYSVELRCQLPNGDLETLISIRSDEELANLIEEYRRCSPASKIRAVLSPPKSLKTVSPPTSAASSMNLRTFTAVDYQSPQAVVGLSAGVRFHYNQYRGGGSPTRLWLCSDPRCYYLDRHSSWETLRINI